MPAGRNHSGKGMVVQAAAVQTEEWARWVATRMPTELEAQARTLGAFQRVRGVSSPSDLLRALLAYVLCAPSFRQVGAWAVLLGVANISEAAWRQRLRRASRWLCWLAGELLAGPSSAPGVAPHGIGRVYLADGSVLAQVGGAGDEWRLHSAYELVSGRLAQVLVSDHHSGEHLGHYTLQAGDLVVADRNYSTLSNVKSVRQQQAHLLARYTLGHCPMQSDQHEPFDVVAWLQADGPTLREQRLWTRDEPHTALRLLAYALPQEQAESARRKLRARAKDKGRTVSAATLFLAGWLVLVSTLTDPGVTAQQLARLYRARWQIELLFKRFKQLLNVHQIRCRTPIMAQATIHALLVAWALQEAEARQIRACLARLLEPTPHLPIHRPAILSSWTLTALCLETLRALVRGQWSIQHLHASWPLLQRFLCSNPRRRSHLESDLRAWLLDWLAHPAPSTAL